MNPSLINWGDPIKPVSGTVVGNAEIKVEDFNQVKCPFCGRELRVSGIECPTSDHTNTIIIHAEQWVDGFGQNHSIYFGRSNREIESQIRMQCPANCIRDMLVNIKNTVVGQYRHLSEYD